MIYAQVTTSPAVPTPNDEITVTLVTTGTGLEGYTGDVYAHTGVITNESADLGDWKYVKTNWGVNTAETKLSRESANLYSLEIGPAIRDYYGVPANETITHLAFVFRSADSSKEGKDDGGKDIFAEVFDDAFAVSIIQPDGNRVLDPGDTILFEAASNQEADLSLFMDETLVKSVSGTSISNSFIMNSTGDYWIRVSATSGDETVADSVFINSCTASKSLTDAGFCVSPEGLLAVAVMRYKYSILRSGSYFKL